MERRPSSLSEFVAFQKAYALSLSVHKLSLSFPKAEQFELASQIRRSSKGVCANLAEGFGKWFFSRAEFRRYVIIALGSADETRLWSRYCHDLGYISKDQALEWHDGYVEIAKMLQGLAQSLTSSSTDN